MNFCYIHLHQYEGINYFGPRVGYVTLPRRSTGSTVVNPPKGFSTVPVRVMLLFLHHSNGTVVVDPPKGIHPVFGSMHFCSGCVPPSLLHGGCR